MAYKPTLFTPIELVDRINGVLNPLEKSFHQLLKHPALGQNTRNLVHEKVNLFEEFRANQQRIINESTMTPHLSLKR